MTTNLVTLTNSKWEKQKPIYEAARNADVAVWLGTATVDKYDGDYTADQISAGSAGSPYETVLGTPNLLTYGGASALWHRLIGGTTTTAFSNALAYIGVGDSTTAAANTQNNLVGTTNSLRVAMDSTYPQHTDSTSSGAHQVVFKSTFGSSDANWAWNEWAIFNASTSGRMLNRKVESLGTKASGSTWVLTLTLSLA